MHMKSLTASILVHVYYRYNVMYYCHCMCHMPSSFGKSRQCQLPHYTYIQKLPYMAHNIVAMDIEQ